MGAGCLGGQRFRRRRWECPRLRVFAWWHFSPSFGTPGSNPGQLSNPRGLAIDRGLVFVAEDGNHRVSVFKVDGAFVGMFGSGLGKPFDGPVDIVVSGERVFVVDTSILVYRLDGTPVRELLIQDCYPIAAAVSGDRLYVAVTYQPR